MMQDTTQPIVQDATSAAPAAQPIISRLHSTVEAAQGMRFDPLDIATWKWDAVLWGNTLKTWLIAIAIAVVLQAIFWVFRKYAVLGRARSLASKTNSLVDDFVVELLSDLRYWWVATVSLVLASKVLYMGQPIEVGGVSVATSRLHTVAIIVTALQLLLSSRIVVKYAIQALLRRTTHADGTVDETINTSTGVLRALGMFAICTIIVLLALDNLGVKVTPLLTGLGIGGIAIALAAQNILGDLFASFIIIFDKPFVVGDAITVGDKSGTVEKIGIKTTRVRASTGEQLVFGNASLLGSTVQNFKRMQERRVTATYGVTYETPAAKLRDIPGIVKSALERHEHVRYERCHLKALNTFSVDFELVYWITSPDFSIHVSVQHALNLELLERFAAEGIEFAYPTQTEIVKDFSRPGEEKTSKRG